MADRRKFIKGTVAVATVAITGCTGTEEETPLTLEETPLTVSHTWGPESHRNHRWEDNQLIMMAGDENADEDDFEGSMVDGHLVLSTENPIDMSHVNEIKFRFRHTSIGGNQDISFLAVSRDREAVRVKPVRHHAGKSPQTVEEEDVELASNINESFYTQDRDMTERTNGTMEVGDISGERFLGVGVNIGSRNREEMTLEIFELYGIDDTGERIFELDFSNENISPV